jgi:hypothetical protein
VEEIPLVLPNDKTVSTENAQGALHTRVRDELDNYFESNYEGYHCIVIDDSVLGWPYMNVADTNVMQAK